MPGQITTLRGDYYRAEALSKLKPCTEQCDCKMRGGQCTGFCFRWANGEAVVFKATYPKEGQDITVVETQYMADCRKQQEEAHGL